mgnify:CR=1 FL=1
MPKINIICKNWKFGQNHPFPVCGRLFLYYFRVPDTFSNQPEKGLLDPPSGLSLNQFREPSHQMAPPPPPPPPQPEEDESEEEDDFQRGLDFDNMVFDQSQKVFMPFFNHKIFRRKNGFLGVQSFMS